jgi:hypothetical protein
LSLFSRHSLSAMAREDSNLLAIPEEIREKRELIKKKARHSPATETNKSSATESTMTSSFFFEVFQGQASTPVALTFLPKFAKLLIYKFSFANFGRNNITH